MFDLKCGVRLREFRPPPATDLDDILAMYNNAQVAPVLDDGFVVPRGQKFKDTMRATVENTAEMFCIIETIPFTASSPEKDVNSSGAAPVTALPEFVGIAGLWAQGERGNRRTGFSIALMPQFWGKGYGTEITKFIVDHGFSQMNMHRISIQVFEGNERAMSVYKKLGFVEEGRMRKAIWGNGKWIDNIIMGLLVEEWKEMQKLGGSLEGVGIRNLPGGEQ